MKIYVYGMRLRGFSPGCQPKESLINFEDSSKSQTGYHGFLRYSRKLEEKELYDYELDYIKEEE